MAGPVVADIPHKLGREAARARLEKGISKIGQLAPGGGTVEEQWDGDTVTFTLSAMGQTLKGKIDVLEDHVHAELKLPMMLSMMSGMVKEKLEQEMPKLLA